MRAKLYLTDRCNLRCKGCHWFSGEVLNPGDVDADAAIDWCKKNARRVRNLVLTGGEPTLHERCAEIADKASLVGMSVVINTNGARLDVLREIKRPCSIVIGLNRVEPESWNKEVAVLPAHLRVTLQTYRQQYMTRPGMRLVRDQMDGLPVGSGVAGTCSPKVLTFGTDGYAYRCEVGLRTKDPQLRTGASLWGGSLNVPPLVCHTTAECLSGLIDEQHFHPTNGDIPGSPVS